MAIVLKQLVKHFTVAHNHTFIHRTIMTSSSRCEKVVEELKTNPYYDKYSQKIATLKKSAPEEFMARVDASEKVKSKPKFGGLKQRQFSPLLKPKEELPKTVEVKDKSLSDLMKIDLVKEKDASEIKTIWGAYHLQKDVISAVIPADIYNTITERIIKYPTFIFPLPRSQGYEFIMCQFFRNTIHFTPLICYQVHKENAPECLTMTHYTEFKDSKKIVLMRGEFDKDVIDAKEAQCLANQLQFYYGQNDAKKVQILDQFTNKPDDFKHTDLIAELENLSL